MFLMVTAQGLVQNSVVALAVDNRLRYNPPL